MSGTGRRPSRRALTASRYRFSRPTPVAMRTGSGRRRLGTSSTHTGGFDTCLSQRKSILPGSSLGRNGGSSFSAGCWAAMAAARCSRVKLVMPTAGGGGGGGASSPSRPTTRSMSQSSNSACSMPWAPVKSQRSSLSFSKVAPSRLQPRKSQSCRRPPWKYAFERSVSRKLTFERSHFSHSVPMRVSPDRSALAEKSWGKVAPVWSSGTLLSLRSWFHCFEPAFRSSSMLSCFAMARLLAARRRGSNE